MYMYFELIRYLEGDSLKFHVYLTCKYRNLLEILIVHLVNKQVVPW